MAKAAKAVPSGFHTITPQLTVDNAAQTIEWYKKALGAKEIGRGAAPDGKIMHAELEIGDSRFYANDVMGEGKGPRASADHRHRSGSTSTTAMPCSIAP